MPSVPEKICRAPIASTIKAWREKEGRYRLQGVVCRNCKEKIFPKVEVCPYCHSQDLEITDFKHTGRIVTDPEQISYHMYGFQELSPYHVAIVELDDGPSILAELVRCPYPMDFKKGAKVEMVLRKLKREEIGNYMYGFKFRIVD